MPAPSEPDMSDPDQSHPEVSYGVHLETFRQLPRRPAVPRLTLRGQLTDSGYERLLDAGVAAVEQGSTTTVDPQRCNQLGIDVYAGLTWGIRSGDRKFPEKVRRLADEGHRGVTLLCGSPLDGEAEVRARVEELLELQSLLGIPICLETHRGTITQYIGTTVALAEAYPELVFNLDYSHWFFAHRLWNEDVDAVVAAIAPVLRQVGHLHLRVSSPAEVQVALADAGHLPHFLGIWSQALEITERPQLAVVTELLPAVYGYSSGDANANRWEDSLNLLGEVRTLVGAHA